ncbi:RNA methylase family protein [Phyllosticta citriasiana]|uniref:tRNA (guanine(10)-N(2))-methyltransferase n=1 Tax=Phyllosticta citriasiana TaxID=595635 RepID=A0ABR1KCF0_9PEZI
MEYLIRLVQVHESFRKAELEALATLAGLSPLEFVFYEENTPFCIIKLASSDEARALIRRSILSAGIYELWGQGSTYEELHADVKARTASKWAAYKQTSFRFSVDAFQGKRSPSQQRELINSFRYMELEGVIDLKSPSLHLCIHEDWELGAAAPRRLFLGRWLADGDRRAIVTYDLKKRRYISTTSMDAELALVTANMALAAPGRLFFDPFVGTGSFSVAAAHFGATAMGSDIDGRSIRGKGKDRCVRANFVQYGTTGRLLDNFISDLTNTPLRIGAARWLDGIVCDPPYGVREGLKVLGRKDGGGKEAVIIDGQLAHLRDGYVPPKRPYSFDVMLDDILDFAVRTLVDGGRLSMWMPTANDDDIDLPIPAHPALRLVSVCVQPFNKWSRRLLTYERRADGDVDPGVRWEKRVDGGAGAAADELNAFRRKYFQGFKTPEELAQEAAAAAASVESLGNGSSTAQKPQQK